MSTLTNILQWFVINLNGKSIAMKHPKLFIEILYILGDLDLFTEAIYIYLMKDHISWIYCEHGSITSPVIQIWSQMRWILFSVKLEVNESKMISFSQGFRQIGSEFSKNLIHPCISFFSWKNRRSSFTLSSNMTLKDFVHLTLYFRSSLSMIFMLLLKQVLPSS